MSCSGDITLDSQAQGSNVGADSDVSNREDLKHTLAGLSEMEKYTLKKNGFLQNVAPGPERDYQNNLAFRCSICGKKVFKLDVFKTHLIVHSEENPFHCTLCNFQTKRPFTLKKHMESHRLEKIEKENISKVLVTAVLSEDEKKILNKKGYLAYLAPGSLRNPQGELALDCPTCARQFFGGKSLGLHLKVHSEKTIKCDFCDYRTYSKQLLNAHLVRCTDNKPYTCEICGLRLATTYEAMDHRNMHEKSKKSLSCLDCGETFEDGILFKNHIKRRHQGYKPHECDVCGRRCANRRELQVHRKTHTGNKLYTCELCGLGLTRMDYFNVHMKLHEKKKEDRECYFCKEIFSDNVCFNVHRRKHSEYFTKDSRHFQCSLCDQKRKQYVAIVRHFQLFHPERIPFSSLESSVEIATADQDRPVPVNKSQLPLVAELLRQSYNNQASCFIIWTKKLEFDLVTLVRLKCAKYFLCLTADNTNIELPKSLQKRDLIIKTANGSLMRVTIICSRYWEQVLHMQIFETMKDLENHLNKISNSHVAIHFMRQTQPATCSPKSYGSGKMACVCNSTYCDDFPRVNTIPTGQAVVISSSQNGQRFSRSQVAFTPLNTGTLKFLSQVTITVDPTTKFQEIIGFGGAFTDAAGINIASLSQGTQDKLMESYFSNTGLEYSTGRVPIASTDFSTRIYSYDDSPGDFALSNFNLAAEDLQYKKAMDLSGGNLTLFASSWSAPGWMKNSGNMSGPGVLKNEPQYYTAYTNYLVRFFEEYASQGVNFWGMTTQNEPTSGFVPFYPWQTMGFTAQTQRDFIKNYLGPALQGNPKTKDLKVMILDDNRSFLILPLLPNWADVIFSDPVATQYVHGTGVHWYSNKYSSAEVLTKTYNNHPTKFILATEACTGTDSGSKGPSMGDWSRAEAYAEDIITDLNNYVAGWTDWNLCLDTQGGPTWVPNYVDSPIIVNKTKDEFYKQPIFYAMGHFSKFMRPGSNRFKVSITVNLLEVSATGTVDATGRRALTILNKGDINVNTEIQDITNPLVSLKLNLAAHSIVTVLWN